MKKKDQEIVESKKVTRVIIFNLAFIIFGLAGLASGTMAWFLTSTTFETRMESFSVVAPPGVSFELYYLDHFTESMVNKTGNWNTTISEYSGYSSLYEDVTFQKVEYNDDHSVNTTNTHGKDPTDIQKLWPAHQLTYALVLNESAPTRFALKSWAEEVKAVSPAQAIDQEIGVVSIQKIDEEIFDEVHRTNYEITFLDNSVVPFYVPDGGDPVSESDAVSVEISGSDEWIVNSVNTGISSLGEGGELQKEVLSIEKTEEGGDTDTYEITFSDLSRYSFSYNEGSGSIASVSDYIPTIEVDGDPEVWVIDDYNTGISVGAVSGTDADSSLSIEKTDSEEVDAVIIDTYRITFSNSSTLSFKYNTDSSVVTPIVENSHTVSIDDSKWVVDGSNTDIAVSVGQEIATIDVNLSWAINLYGRAYSVEQTGDDAADIASSFADSYLDYLEGNEKEDVFAYSQSSPAPDGEKPAIEILESSDIPVNESGHRTIVFFTIEFSNNPGTYYLFDEKSGNYQKNVNGDSRCYEGLSLTELSFALS